MYTTNRNELSDRRNAATDAKAARLQAYLAAKEAAEPMREARQGKLVALAEARDARQALREQAKLEEQARRDAERREREAAVAAAATHGSDTRELAANNRVARVLADEATRKAERDRRYASRKARQA